MSEPSKKITERDVDLRSLPRQATFLSLFTGIGGIDLAAEMAGLAIAGQCELDSYATKILEKHWPNVPRWKDIHDVTAESFYRQTGMRTVDVVGGGFPCQPFSVAGQQKGPGDERNLWPEMLRVVKEIRPGYVVAENVPGIMQIAGDSICQDLEREGYNVRVFAYEAAAVGAPHRRERVFFVADANPVREQQPDRCIGAFRERACDRSKAVADAKSDGQQRVWPTRKQVADARCVEREPERRGGGRAAQPQLGRVAYGLSVWLDGAIAFPPEPDMPRTTTEAKNRAKRLKCLGNAVVWQQAYPIFAAIAEISTMTSAKGYCGAR